MTINPIIVICNAFALVLGSSSCHTHVMRGGLDVRECMLGPREESGERTGHDSATRRRRGRRRRAGDALRCDTATNETHAGATGGCRSERRDWSERKRVMQSMQEQTDCRLKRASISSSLRKLQAYGKYL